MTPLEDKKMLIGGDWVPAASGATFATINPATGEAICSVQDAGEVDVDLAVDAARRAFRSDDWARMDASARGRLLFRLSGLSEGNAGELAKAGAPASGGCPPHTPAQSNGFPPRGVGPP